MQSPSGGEEKGGVMPEALTTERAPAQQRVDAIQFHLGKFPPVDCPVTHRFTPGLYTREIFMPKGSAVVSRVHKTEHPYVVVMGRALVWTEEGGVVEVGAGTVGITRAGTRRVLYIQEDCRWLTFHPTKETDLAKLQDELTHTPDVSYIGELNPQIPDTFAALVNAIRLGGQS